MISNTIFRILNIGALFIITILLSRIAGVTGFGIISLFITNITVFHLFTSFGADAAATYFTVKKTISPNKIVTVLLILVFLQLVFISLIEVCLQFYNKSFRVINIEGYSGIALGGIFCISLSIIEKFSALLYGKQQFELTSKIVLSGNLFLLISLIILSFLRIHDLYFFLSVYISIYFLQAISLIGAYYKVSNDSFSLSFFKWKELKTFFSFSALIYLINSIQFVAYRVDFWFINYYQGIEELGWYSLSVRLVQMFWILPNLLSIILYPKIAAARSEETEFDLLRLVRLSNFFNLIIGVIIFFASGWLIPAFFGKSYMVSVQSFRILLPGVAFFSITTILASYFGGINKLHVNLTGSILCVVLIFLLDYLLIPKYGISGAAIASSIGYTLTTFYFIYTYLIQRDIHIKKIFLLERQDIAAIKTLVSSFVKK